MLYWKVQFEKCARPLHFCAGINTICLLSFEIKSTNIVFFGKKKKRKASSHRPLHSVIGRLIISKGKALSFPWELDFLFIEATCSSALEHVQKRAPDISCKVS